MVLPLLITAAKTALLGKKVVKAVSLASKTKKAGKAAKSIAKKSKKSKDNAAKTAKAIPGKSTGRAGKRDAMLKSLDSKAKAQIKAKAKKKALGIKNRQRANMGPTKNKVKLPAMLRKQSGI